MDRRLQQPLSPTSPTGLSKERTRVALAAALLSHDTSSDPSSAASTLPLHSSALLSPFLHLLPPPGPADPPTPTSAEDRERDGSAEVGDDGEKGESSGVQPGSGANTGSETAGAPGRPGSLISSMLWSVGGKERTAPPALNLNPEEEEKLADEWGINKALSDVAESLSGKSPTSPGFGSMAGIGLSRFPTAAVTVARSEAGLLDQERKLEALAEAADEEEEEMELLETRSMPDLDRPRVLSFAEAVLGGLDQRMKEKVAVKAIVGSSSDGGKAMDDDEVRSDGPRIKILERTAAQRSARLRTQSSGPALGLASLPTFGDLAAVTEASSSTSGGNGIASRDSLFLGPRSRAYSGSGNASRPLSSYSVVQPSRRGSLDAVSRLSLAIPSGLPDSAPPLSPISPTSSSSALPPFPGTSPSAVTPIEPPSPAYVSRFDPNFIAAQRAELLRERPHFANSDAGKPPKVVLMPAPLAGRPPSPVRKPRVEGPNSGDEEEESEEEEEEVDEEDKEPKRPAGALYGRSLMDVMNERKAVQQGQNKSYVSGNDGRRAMMEWKEENSSPAAAGALARLEGHVVADEDHEEREDDVPLALVPAGGAHLREKAQAARFPASRSQLSIFGPDLIYQRELAKAKELEAEEQAERERVEAIEEAKRVKARLKEEKRKSRGVLKKTDKRKSGGFPALESSREWQARDIGNQGEEGFYLASPVAQTSAQKSPTYSLHPPSPARPRTTHTLAPSLSIPVGLGAVNASASGGDWFRPPSPPVRLTNDSDSEEEEELYRPRPISSLGLNKQGMVAGGNARQSRHFGSDSSSEDNDSEVEEITQTALAPATKDRRLSLPFPGEPSLNHDANLDGPALLTPSSVASRHLPLPGEASSIGHDVSSVVDTEEDRPLGVRYSRVLQQGANEDEEPLGRRYSRNSLMMPLDLPRAAPSPKLDLDFGGNEEENGAKNNDSDSDDEPLGQRYSTILPIPDGEDEDDVPLAIHRLSLATTNLVQPNRFEQPSARLHAIDDDGKTVASEDSDDAPLGLKAAPPPSMYPQQQQQPGGFGFYPSPQPAFVPGFPQQLPYNNSGFFHPAAAVAPPFLPSAMPGAMPFGAPSLYPGIAPPPPDPMQLALAQMQMHSATMQQQGGGGGAGIERWRREVGT